MRALLSEVPIEEVRATMPRVISQKTGVRGVVFGVSDKPDREDNTIDIRWDNGRESRGVWHFWCDKIEVIE